MGDKQYMTGKLASVSACHVVALRIIPSNDGWLLQALTTDWAIDLDSFPNLSEAGKMLEEGAQLLRHQ